MRLFVLLVILILFGGLPTRFATAQPSSEISYSGLKELNESLAQRMGSKGMGFFTGRYFFEVDLAGRFNLSFDEKHARFEEPFLNFLHEHRSVFTDTGRYYVYIYYDRLSKKFYPNFEKPDSLSVYFNEAIINYPAQPKSSLDHFLSVVEQDLIDNFDSTMVEWNDWNQPLEVLVYLAEKEENEPYRKVVASFIDNNNFVRFMDKSKDIQWHVALYNANPMASILSVRIDSARFLNEGVLDVHFYEREQYVLEARYNGHLVRFIDSFDLVALPPSRLGVSFVLQPGVGFVDPVMHYGNMEEIQDFIRWMSGLSVEANRLYVPRIPQSRRYFFFLR